MAPMKADTYQATGIASQQNIAYTFDVGAAVGIFMGILFAGTLLVFCGMILVIYLKGIRYPHRLVRDWETNTPVPHLKTPDAVHKKE